MTGKRVAGITPICYTIPGIIDIVNNTYLRVKAAHNVYHRR